MPIKLQITYQQVESGDKRSCATHDVLVLSHPLSRRRDLERPSRETCTFEKDFP